MSNSCSLHFLVKILKKEKQKKNHSPLCCAFGEERERESEQFLTSNTELMAHPLVHSCLGCPVVEWMNEGAFSELIWCFAFGQSKKERKEERKEKNQTCEEAHKPAETQRQPSSEEGLSLVPNGLFDATQFMAFFMVETQTTTTTKDMVMVRPHTTPHQRSEKCFCDVVVVAVMGFVCYLAYELLHRAWITRRHLTRL